ncbi:MAG: chromosome segregation protein SMC [Thermoguttaceae bacterium]|nr:chromosome segregation protein SMC [Thermoguttaceae bacterium]MDW8039415.1 chromosome segregation protein SMC [Thermoguttaceae bacterium]
MLKALELFGFKSFADRTRFEFPPGITAIVGPNGSGKSNIVDAIKWVLGEQSVKSLRGMEMADVIFNGSENRRPMQSAEVTLTFDNSKRFFPLDSDEVHLTRRVYRSGESEYLINRQPCRLKDIRDLLAGTGLGSHAYCVIEQGRVDVLLQASSKDRRVLFEEAAGISRFKAKKTEALRRLERVEQNLVRLRDIVEEVESRLRSVRQQAAKARRYQQYTNRLQELRTQVAWADWTQWAEQLAQLAQQEAALSADRLQRVAEAETLETQQLELETQIAQLHEAIRSAETQHTAYRERIAAEEAAVEHHRSQLRDLSDQLEPTQRQILALSLRSSDVQQQMAEMAQALAEAQTHHQQLAQSLDQQKQTLQELDDQLRNLQADEQQLRTEQRQLLEKRADWESQRSRLEAMATAASQAQTLAQQRLAELRSQWEENRQLAESISCRQDLLQTQAAQLCQQIAAEEARLAQLQQRQQNLQAQIHELTQRQTALHERKTLLEELLGRQEGVSPGIKQLLLQRQQTPHGPLDAIVGLLADLIHTPIEAAPLVEIALGEWSQYLVARPSQPLWEYLQAHAAELPGRVGILWLEETPASEGNPEAFPDLRTQPGVLARADSLVQTEPAYQKLIYRLLARTWIVDSLQAAQRLAKQAPDCHFVTLSGERLSAEGVLEIGPRPALGGGISRRSELRWVQTQLEQLQATWQTLQVQSQQLQAELTLCQEQLQTAQHQWQQLRQSLAELQQQMAVVEERFAQYGRQQEALEAEIRAAALQAESAQIALAQSASEGDRLAQELAQKDAQLAHLAQQISHLQLQRGQLLEQISCLQVELAKSQERLDALHSRLRQVEEAGQERRRQLADLLAQLSQTQNKIQQLKTQILQRQSRIAELYLAKEAVAGRIRDWLWTQQQWRQRRSELAAAAQQAWAGVRKIEEELHNCQLVASQLRQQQAALAQRFQEEYGIDLAALQNGPPEQDGRSRQEVLQEIEDLRRKIHHLGNVNLEALEELQQLETRYEGLRSQYDDLVKAKTSLQRVIERINTESRRLFLETLETIRTHFHDLFRDLFGGGKADILLEEGVDVLESGVEIVARPPGKEPRSISLLSGGEKTLTCVALLLAIFRSRPSPFCILDEVDAALDEANIDRFIKVLKDFLSITQFILVTHSKKTMTCADTLYGVTMQESGVSKQVSVRFEDISEDGRVPMLESSASAEAEADQQAA